MTMDYTRQYQPSAVNFIEFEGMKPFSEHYNEHIFPVLNAFEMKRRSVLKNFYLRLFIGIILGILYCALHYYVYVNYISPNTSSGSEFRENIYIISLGIIFLVFLGIFYFVTLPIKKYKDDIKKVIFPKIFSYFGSDTKFTSDNRDIRGLYLTTGLFNFNYSEKIGYGVSGVYENIKYDIYEVKLSTHRRSDGRRRKSTVFKGLFIFISGGREFSGKTIISRDYGSLFGNKVIGALSGLGGYENGKKMERVKFNDNEFEKHFEVLSTVPDEARDVMDSGLLKTLIKLSNEYGPGSVQCSLVGSRKVLTLHKNYFKVSSIFVPCTFESDINDILLQMRDVFNVIDALKANQKIGM